MKRALIALVAVGFVVAAISIARANSGEDTPEAKPSDTSRQFDRELTTKQIKQQADQLHRAQAELARKVRAEADAHSHTLVVTIREEHPGDVWVTGKVDGKPACVTPPRDSPTYIRVSALPADVKLAIEVVPLEAELLKSGACQASVELFVPRVDGYEITVSRPGHPFGLARVGHDGQSQKVTIVG